MAGLRDQTRTLRRVLYRFKRQWGLVADLYHTVSETTNFQTGRQSVSIQKWHINRALLLPTRVDRQQLLGGSFDEANRKFDYGAVMEVGLRQVIIDRRDLPSDVVITTENWYLIISAQRFEIKNVELWDENAAFVLMVKELTGSELAQFVELMMKEPVNTTDSQVVNP